MRRQRDYTRGRLQIDERGEKNRLFCHQDHRGDLKHSLAGTQKKGSDWSLMHRLRLVSANQEVKRFVDGLSDSIQKVLSIPPSPWYLVEYGRLSWTGMDLAGLNPVFVFIVVRDDNSVSNVIHSFWV